MKNRKTALLGVLSAVALTAMTACGSNTDTKMNSGIDSNVNNVTNGTDQKDGTKREDTMGDDIKNTGKDIKDGTRDVVDGAGDATKDVVDGAGNAAKDVVDGVEKGTKDVVDGVEQGVDHATGNDNTKK